MVVYGINTVSEALRSGRVLALRVTDRVNARVAEIVSAAERDGVSVRRVSVADLDRAARGGVHQGIVAELRERDRFDVADLVQGARGPALIVVLDGIEDPHNVGAILRTVDAAGGDGVIRQSRRAAALDGAAAKASAGAVSHVKIADVVNIARALEELKEAGVWTIGLAGDAPKLLTDIDLTLPTALVLGAEGEGLRRLVRERCDWLASIPLRGHVQSLNVSVAAGVALFEAVRQRSSPSHPTNR
jgi:23S rRNA (guanosine2251-2'-O)-methyltransferase